jgi:hypothetical protein
MERLKNSPLLMPGQLIATLHLNSSLTRLKLEIQNGPSHFIFEIS